MKRLVLLGGGHAHVHVLKAFAAARPAAAEVLLVTPYPRQIYSGMVPGFVAGHYSEAQCVIPLEPLARAAGVMTAWGAATALDAAARTITLADGRVAEYDVLSIDTGSVIDRDRIPGAREHGLFVRPMEHFVKLYDGLVDLAARRVVDVVVLGGGAAGVELAMALAHRLAGRGEERARIALVTGGPEPLAGYPERVMALARAALAAMRVTVFRDACAEVQAGAVLLRGGARLACDAPIIATGADAPRWLQGSGLALDERGFVLTGPTLQSRSHDAVFAAGDVATRADAPHAKSGVYAVRAGPPLALNLRRAVAGGALLPHQPQPRTLNLVSCGARRAIVSWGGLGLAGRWAWWWKDRIDRAFIARYAAAAAAGSGLTGPSAGS